MTPRQREIVALVAEGWSVPAIAGRVKASENAVRLVLSRLGVSAVRRPPGHLTIREAALRVPTSTHKLYRALRGLHGSLRSVKAGGRYFTTRAWLLDWLENIPQRVKAREMMRKLFAYKAHQTARASHA